MDAPVRADNRQVTGRTDNGQGRYNTIPSSEKAVWFRGRWTGIVKTPDWRYAFTPGPFNPNGEWWPFPGSAHQPAHADTTEGQAASERTPD